MIAATALGVALTVTANATIVTARAQPTDLLEQLAPQDSDQPVLLLADELIYDQDRSLVIARGNVYLSQDERLLRADQVTYDQVNDLVTASGGIVLREPSGEYIFADYAELTGDLRNGFVENVAIRFNDNARMIANIGIRRDGQEIEVERAVYSPCELCAEDPTRAPVWQVRATRVIHNSESRNVEYENAYLDIFGLPVLWLPYFYHPDPTVERRTGFLPPDLGSSPELGSFGIVNNYWDLTPSSDLTTSFMITAERSVMARGVYRQRFTHGAIRFDGSANYSERFDRQGGNLISQGDEFRGHIFGDGEFAIDDSWRAGFQLQEVTDDTYLDVFRIDDADILQNRAYAEGFYGLSFVSIEAFEFTDLRPDVIDQPIVAPWAQFSYRGEPGDAVLGGQWIADVSALALARGNNLTTNPSATEGVDTIRLHARGGWQTQEYLPNGLVFSADVSLAGTLYWSRDLPDPANPGMRGVDDFAARFTPTAGAQLAYPLVRYDGEVRQLVEPIVSFRATGLFDNDGIVPNNDSPTVEFDEINLFSESRYPGLDAVDDGLRLTYGLRLGWFDPNGISGTGFIGQSLRLDYDRAFPNGSGLADDLSDLVGRVTIQANDWIDFDWRFRLDTEDLTGTRSEVSINLDTGWLEGTARYTFVDAQAGTRTGNDVEEFYIAGEAPISEFWSVNGSYRRDLTTSETRAFSLGVQYLDECLLVGFEWTRDFTRDREQEPGDSFMLRLSLIHLTDQPLDLDTGEF